MNHKEFVEKYKSEKLSKAEKRLRVKLYKKFTKKSGNLFQHWVLLMIFGLAIFPNIFIVPLVLFYHSKGNCVVYIPKGSSFDSCGLLSNPLYNIFSMNLTFWLIMILIVTYRYIVGFLFKKKKL